MFCTKPPDLSRIIAAAKGTLSPIGRLRLLADLKRAREAFGAWRETDLSSSHATAEREMGEVGWYAAAILGNCLVDAKVEVSRENIKPAYWTKLAIQGAGSERAVFNAIAAVASLKVWACAVAEAEKVRKVAQATAPDPDNTSAKTWLIASELPRIYQKHFRKFPMWRGGPGIAFVRACLLEINDKWKPSPESILVLIRRHRSRRRHRPRQ